MGCIRDALNILSGLCALALCFWSLWTVENWADHNTVYPKLCAALGCLAYCDMKFRKVDERASHAAGARA